MVQHTGRSTRLITRLSCLLFLSLLIAGAGATKAVTPPNILLIIVDDVGIEHLEMYDLQDILNPEYAITGELTNLYDSNDLVAFTNAWSTPVCSSTRMSIQTGLYGFETGVGGPVKPSDEWQPDLDEGPSDFFLADLMRNDSSDPYSTSAFGKWHLGAEEDTGEPGDDAPDHIGYDDYHVMYYKDNSPLDYFTYTDVESTGSGPQTNTDTVGYFTKDTADWFIDWLETSPTEPWFSYVAFTAAHSPFHCPPAADYTGISCSTADPDIDLYYDMIDALDQDIERMLDALVTEGVDDNTVYIFVGDNGSESTVVKSPVTASKAKGSVAQGGVRVPLLFGGFVDGTELAAVGDDVSDIVNVSDLYDTILDLGNVTGPGRSDHTDDHSVSLRKYLDENSPVERDCAYTEFFSENNSIVDVSYNRWDIAVRDSEYKYAVKKASGQELLFRLEGGATPDPWEESPITNNTKKWALQKCGDALFGDCVLRLEDGEDCTDDEECCSESCGVDVAGECDARL